MAGTISAPTGAHRRTSKSVDNYYIAIFLLFGILDDMSVTISKITRAGQITLPKKLRTKAFAGASAVVFEDRGKEVVIKPVHVQKIKAEEDVDNWYMPLVEHTMRDWLDSENDNLFKLPKKLQNL